MQKDEITSDEDFKKALARLDEIWSTKPGEENWAERSSLVESISAYEDRHVKIAPPDPMDAIQFRMEQGGLRPKDLIRFIGSASKVSEVLSGQRSLSKEMIRQLHIGLGIPLASLLGISEGIPTGYVQVDWVIPAHVAENVATAANALGIKEEDWVTQKLMATAMPTGDGKALKRRATEKTPSD